MNTAQMDWDDQHGRLPPRSLPNLDAVLAAMFRDFRADFESDDNGEAGVMPVSQETGE